MTSSSNYSDSSSSTKNDEPTGLIIFLSKKGLINNAVEKKMTLLGHILLAGGLVGTVIITYCIMFLVAGRLNREWLKCEVAYSTEELAILALANSDEKPLQIRQQQQLKTIDDLTVRHCKIMSFFYIQYFIALSIGGFAAILCLLMTFFISKEGWAKTNNAVINIWVTSFMVTLFYLNIAQIFQQQENLKTSQDLYASYLALHNQLVSSVATAKYKNPPSSSADLIEKIDSKLQELSFIRIGFDPTPIVKIQETVGTGIMSNSDTSKKPSTSPSPTPR